MLESKGDDAQSLPATQHPMPRRDLQRRRSSARVEKLPLRDLCFGDAGRTFKRKNSERVTWEDAKALALALEAVDSWQGTTLPAPKPEPEVQAPVPPTEVPA